MYYFCLLLCNHQSFITDFSKGNMVLILWSMCAQGVCVHVCGCSVTQLCPTLCDPTDCNPLGSSFHGIFQTRILEQVAICYTRGSSQLWDQTTYLVSPALAGRFFTTMPPGKPRAHAVIAKKKKKKKSPSIVFLKIYIMILFRYWMDPDWLLKSRPRCADWKREKKWAVIVSVISIN